MEVELESKTNFIKLINQICIVYKINPHIETNIRNIKAFLEPLDSKSLLSKYNTIDEINNSIVLSYSDYINNKSNLPNEMSKIKKYLIDAISIPGDDNTNLDSKYKDKFKFDKFVKERLEQKNEFLNLNELDKLEIVKYLNYESLWRDTYIFIDSRYQNIYNTDRSKILFSLTTNSKHRSDNGNLLIGDIVKDIIQIELFPFTIPYNPKFANFYNKITFTINEWTCNSFQAYENGAFHFILDIVKIDNNLIYLKPVDNIFRFSTPVNYIDNFSISFGAILDKITFDIDRLYITNIDYTSTNGMITFGSEHNLVTGDLIYISGFTTLNTAKDINIINEMNRISGHIIVKKDLFRISINVNISLLRIEDPIGSNIYPIDSFSQNILVYLASKRIQIPMRIKYLNQIKK
jgi:hypothetical protein